MFGWRKKQDGFEWHDYVRTTILVRRAKRRQKVGEAKDAAVHGIKDAGAAAAQGLHDAKGKAAEGLRHAAQRDRCWAHRGPAGLPHCCTPAGRVSRPWPAGHGPERFRGFAWSACMAAISQSARQRRYLPAFRIAAPESWLAASAWLH